MLYVEIYNTQDDGAQKTIAVCSLQKNGQVLCESENDQLIKSLGEGIKDYSDLSTGPVFPKDGIHFLKQLKYNFKSGYLNASDLIKKIDV